MTLAKSYPPADIEQKHYQAWEQAGYFKPSGKGDPYCIMIPPPNVTGSLHMGHAFQDTIMDTLVRYHRMLGMNTLWQPGTDHAGIATQMVVERLLAKEGKTRHDIGRDQFIEKIWDWKAESGGNITRQLRRMGASVDWSRERFTMDEGLSDSVQEVFVSWYEKGIIYRGKRLVNWDPVLHTALSDLEVLSEEEKGHMWHLRYPLADGSGHLVVATTRPETMLGDAAVAVHPNDERYQHLLGQLIDLPLTGRQIPIIADEYVDPAFGTGCVKITPAHDFNDYEVWGRHKDEAAIASQPNGGLINLFNISAAIRANTEDENELIPQQYVGLDRYDCRKVLVADLQALGALEKVDNHTLTQPRGDRSGAVVEPYLTDQWYVDLTQETQADGRPGGKQLIIDKALQVVRDKQIQFVPENWENTYFQWLENIQDWCISRQIWWGHRIPAWYGEDGTIYVGRNEAEVREKYGLGAEINLRQDEDVLDTWFSSALWPFSTLGWPQQTSELATFYPTSVLVTGFDIIFFWVARMVMAGVSFMDEIPFKEVYIHGLVRDSHGQKMSKSKGNVLDPIDLIDGISLDDLLIKRTQGLMQEHKKDSIIKQTKADFPDGIQSYGTDPLRFTFATQATTGRDINFSLGRIEGNRNFCNKIWNAARFVLMQVEGKECGVGQNDLQLTVVDRWIRSRIQHTETEISRALSEYRLDRASTAMYEFVWNEYCDWYLELSKPVLNDPNTDEQVKVATRATLVRVFETALRLMHPIMPYITEEIWQKIAPYAGKDNATIMLEPYPQADESKVDSEAEASISWVKEFILSIRKIRGEMDIAPGKPLDILVCNANTEEQALLSLHTSLLQFVGRIGNIELIKSDDDAPESAVALLGELKIMIPLAGLIDKDAEIKRLSKELGNAESEIERINGKLSNEKFISRAPEAVVNKEREKIEKQILLSQQLMQQLSKIKAL